MMKGCACSVCTSDLIEGILGNSDFVYLLNQNANEKENAGVEGAHKTEQAGEAAIDYARRFKRDKYARRANKVGNTEAGGDLYGSRKQ